MSDEPYSGAERCAALGLGEVVQPSDLTPQAIGEAVDAVLGEPAYRRSVERFRDEMLALPGPERIVDLLTSLVLTPSTAAS